MGDSVTAGYVTQQLATYVAQMPPRHDAASSSDILEPVSQVCHVVLAEHNARLGDMHSALLRRSCTPFQALAASYRGW
jgi:hypothetical protein